MRTRNQTRWMRGALAALVIALTGCGETPVTAPSPSAGSSTPQLVGLSGGSATYVTADPSFLSAASLTPRGLTASTAVNGANGGTVTCGRFVVTVPPGAYSGTGTVTMTMPDSTVSVVDLSISPSTLNAFKVAVSLSYDTRGLGLTDPVTIYWYDGKKWVDLVAKVDSKTNLPTVSLKHFSPYGAGKAGW